MHTPMHDPLVVQVFAKAPVPGLAKTRLVTLLGTDGASQLQSAMIEHTLGTCREIPSVRLELWCAPDTSHRHFQDCAHRYGAALMTQRGGNLGERMHRALATALRGGSDAAVLIGTDAPTLSAIDLKTAFSALQGDYDAVVAPALDGGYVLIGLIRPSPTVFRSIVWGGTQVLADTRDRLKRLGSRWLELPAHRDIDRPEDWLWFCRNHPDLAQRLRADPV